MSFTPQDGDILLECIEKDCSMEGKFYFTVRDQEFYEKQNPPWQPPKRCPSCRKNRKMKQNSSDRY